jgi:hypothetical protein
VSPRPGKSITRRQLLGGGALLTAGAVGGGFGRFAVGDEFDEHLAGVLGVPVATAASLTAEAKARTGGLAWQLRRGAFVAATTAPGRWVLPASVREHALHAMIDQLLVTPGDGLDYLGLRPPASGRACAGLIRR